MGWVYARALRNRLRARLEIDYTLLLIAMNCVPHDNLARPTCRSQPVINVTRSPPIGVEKLSGVLFFIFFSFYNISPEFVHIGLVR